MKAKFILAFFLLGGISTLRAQDSDNKNIVRDNFEKNLFHWEDFYEKACKGYIDMAENAYILQGKYIYALSVTRLPVDINRNFKIRMRFLVPTVNKKNYFGIVYNYKDLEGKGDYIGIDYQIHSSSDQEKKKVADVTSSYRTFLVAEGKFRLSNGVQFEVSGRRNMSKGAFCVRDIDGTLILRSGKNKEVELEIEKKGNQLIFSIDNMEVTKVKEDLISNYFGFTIYDNIIKVKEVLIEQLREED